ncbi:hypothetical protein BS50DRAFT_555953 [Corynespora cassiicola Philippines]|uniref:Uncharacterized protein n=1 Tax=Corynespora cassiicola Philippines TaxID=1448308 RepID=A0A2T2NIW8_CORCC|nr:hypothetical protein BS50DRAFT_555953 [Corynespora cassiicola Philippines]
MRSLLAIAFTFGSVASAFPFATWIMTPPPAGTKFYQLQAKSDATAVANQWVTLETGSKSYSLASNKAAATKFFVNKYDPTGTYAFHNADDTRQIALQGSDGSLLYLVDITNPNENNIPGGQLMEWATFTMDNNVLGVKDGSILQNRTFVAARGTGSGYTLALYDGASTVSVSITPITLNIVSA